jgi:predicted DNA-binding transcriptional regulator AlpA
MTTLLTPKAVCERTSLSRSTLDRLVAAGEFVSPVRLTERRLAYDSDAVESWLRAKLEKVDA